MANQGEFITAAEFLNLKAALQTEVQRRSNSRSVGSMATYAGSAYQYTEPPNKGTVEFKSEHIEKITSPLDAITGGSLTPEAGGYVDADTLDAAALKVSELSGKSLTAATQRETGCAASCSGLCYTGCYSACTGCTGTCQGTCQGSCSTTCTGGCKINAQAAAAAAPTIAPTAAPADAKTRAAVVAPVGVIPNATAAVAAALIIAAVVVPATARTTVRLASEAARRAVRKMDAPERAQLLAEMKLPVTEPVTVLRRSLPAWLHQQ